MNLSLKNKTALVCGSTQGIGKAAAIELALLGCNVVLVARNEDKLKATLAELDQAQKQQHGYVCADFSKPDELKTKVEQLVSQRPIHILINKYAYSLR